MTTLYHPDGNMLVWGIKCKHKSFHPDQVEDALRDGWFKSPADFNKGGADTNGDGELTIDEARAYAEKHGINIENLHWKTAVKKVQEHIDGKDKG